MCRLASTKIAQPEPRRRSTLLSRAVVTTSSAGVAESRSGPRKRAVRWKLPSLLRMTPGAINAAQGRKSARLCGLLRYSARFSMSPPLRSEMHWNAHVSTYDLDEIGIAFGGPDRRHVPDDPEDQAGDPQAQAQSDCRRECAVENGDRARCTREQDRLRQCPVHGRFETGHGLMCGDISHHTNAPPAKEKNDKKKDEAANAIDRPKTI